jgi:hypothetical protein
VADGALLALPLWAFACSTELGEAAGGQLQQSNEGVGLSGAVIGHRRRGVRSEGLLAGRHPQRGVERGDVVAECTMLGDGGDGGNGGGVRGGERGTHNGSGGATVGRCSGHRSATEWRWTRSLARPVVRRSGREVRGSEGRSGGRVSGREGRIGGGGAGVRRPTGECGVVEVRLKRALHRSRQATMSFGVLLFILQRDAPEEGGGRSSTRTAVGE